MMTFENTFLRLNACIKLLDSYSKSYSKNADLWNDLWGEFDQTRPYRLEVLTLED